ncbi:MULTISPECIES: hypothetical protein [unclassified Afipia]|nr:MULTISPECIES: hypothetical protein [unclassified Afipia]MBS4003138.1 hypothetical protein [Afipia sp.]
MVRYAIIKDGRDFIVQSGEQSVLKCASRREAAKAIADAKGLMREDTSGAHPSENETSVKAKAQRQLTRSSSGLP